MRFGVGRAELPVATSVRRGARARLRRWLAERWAWLRMRLIPAAAALAGMVLVLVSLTYMAGDPATKKPHCFRWRPLAQYDVDDRGHRIGPTPTRYCRADLEVDRASSSRSRR
jgi:hypothetical protein